MLVYIDSENGTITLCGKSVMTVPISRAAAIKPLLLGKTVQYVTEVINASGEEVIDLIEGMEGFEEFSAPKRAVAPSDGMMWLYATGSGYMNIAAAKMRFDGPEHFILMNEIGYDIFEKHPILQDLLNKKKLAIVTTSQKNRILKEVAARKADQDRKMLLNWTGESMIVDTSGGKLKKKSMDEEFDLILGDDPVDDYLNDAQKAMREFEGLGKEADAEMEAQAEADESEGLDFE